MKKKGADVPCFADSPAISPPMSRPALNLRSSQQVWAAHNPDGSVTVALFNLGSSTATVTAKWSDLGLSGSAAVRDLWSHTALGSFTGSFSASLPKHGSRLLRVTPRSGGATTSTLVNQGSGRRGTAVDARRQRVHTIGQLKYSGEGTGR